jgi:hypothetical protein
MKALLNVSGCELMHLRTAKKIDFIKQGNVFLYPMPNGSSILEHPLGINLINWYRVKHPIEIDNKPTSPQTKRALELLLNEILIPIQRKFANLQITYGFTSSELKRYISKNSPTGTAPEIDQHSSCELNSLKNLICERSGAACDIIMTDTSMAEVVRYIINNLNYDRIYFYGRDRPVHISCSEKPVKHLQIMKETESGRRYPAQKAFNQDAITLAKSL